MSIQPVLSKRIADYKSLPPAQTAMVQIMAVNVDYCRLYAMINWLADLGFKNDNGRKFTSAGIQPLQKELIAKGLLLKSSKGICCPESIRRQAVHDALMENKFTQIAEVIQKNMALPARHTRANQFENYQQVIHSFQIAVFTHTSMDEINSIVKFSKHFFREEYYENNLYVHVVNSPFSRKLIEKVHPEIRLEVLVNLLNAVGRSLEPADTILHYITDSYRSVINGKSEVLLVFSHYLTCGDTTSARSLLADLEENLKPDQLSHTGWLEFISGNYPQARNLFGQGIKLLKKRAGKRKMFFQGYAGVFHLLSLLETGERKHLQEAIDFIDIAKKNNYPFLPLVEAMRPIFQDQLGITGSEISPLNVYNFEQRPLDFLIINLALSWYDKNKARLNIQKLTRLRDQSLEKGYFWLAAEFSALLSTLGQSRNTNKQIAAKLHKSCNTVSCINIVRNQPKWKKTLNGLLNITGSENSSSNKAEQRLVWLFSHNEKYSYCYISPRLQRLNKKGQWTKGRPVALKNLYRNHLTMDGLTEQDHKVCQSIKEEYYRTSWRYGSTEYEFNNDIALPALVGHPLLFLEDAHGVRVELVLSEPELRIRKEKGKLKLSMFPSGIGSTEEKIQVIKDTPTRFKVIRFTRDHDKIVEIMGDKGLIIPKAGEKLARQVADSLASVVTIHSDIETSRKAKTIEADSRPHAHIIPYQDGIQLEFLVKPCGTDGSSFRPGKGGKSVLTEIKGKKIQAVRDFNKEKKCKIRLFMPALP
ncbi:MAG TPA: hypothetical protein ENJ30_12905 [Desulfobulbaceae bacterium]|nr:hypothetical protein [Desulfobulbaceae bacterium]